MHCADFEVETVAISAVSDLDLVCHLVNTGKEYLKAYYQLNAILLVIKESDGTSNQQSFLRLS